jgi:DNA/RNA-binding domain of Phe-tRNA-synthetase-like protein
MPEPTAIDCRLDAPALLLGIAEVAGVERLGDASPELRAECAALAARVAAAGATAEGGSAFLPEARRSAVRRLLKLGGFSPTGRNRPAHELLLNLTREQGSFPHINAAVDVNNLLSMEALLPISLFDADKLGGRCTVRFGQPGESYVFNQSGHSLDVKHCLICADAQGQPCGSPVKDSMASKVFPGCARILAVVYGTAETHSPAAMQALAERCAALLGRECGGEALQARSLRSAGGMA